MKIYTVNFDTVFGRGVIVTATPIESGIDATPMTPERGRSGFDTESLGR